VASGMRVMNDPSDPSQVGVLTIVSQKGKLVLCPDDISVSLGKSRHKLTRLEYALLRVLMEHPYRVFTREELMGRVWWDAKPATGRTVDVVIRRLRMKLGAPGNLLIRTVRGVGYSLEGS
jgi:DNA-binding response OmpR family regulator